MSHVKYQLTVPFLLKLDPKAAPSCIGNQFTLIRNTYSYKSLKGNLRKKIYYILLKVI